MGIILESSVLIAAERKGRNARQVLTELARQLSGEEIALSVITALELAHGVARADSTERRSMRRGFLDELMTALPVHPVTIEVALRAGQMNGENTARSIHLALSDLLIGTTALELRYGVATGNVRHFERVPGLAIVKV